MGVNGSVETSKAAEKNQSEMGLWHFSLYFMLFTICMDTINCFCSLGKV